MLFYLLTFVNTYMDLSVLEKIGLSKAEIQIYLTLLKLGPSPLGIVVRESKFRKSTIYNNITRLQEKGLVSFVIKDSKKYFEATEPERLVEFIHDKKRELENYETEVNELIPKFKKSFGEPRPHAEAHVLVGIEGFKTMRRDMLKNVEGELLLIGAISREDEAMPKFFETWNKTRQRKGIKIKILHKESATKKVMENKEIMGSHFETRFLSEELESPAVINIYGDRVVNVLWKNDYPLCFMIINRDIADSYRKYFNYLWKWAKPFNP